MSSDLYQHIQRLQLSHVGPSSGTNAVSPVMLNGSGSYLPGLTSGIAAVDISYQRVSPPPSHSGGLHIIKEDSGDAGDSMDLDHEPHIHNSATSSISGKYFVNPQISITDAQGHVTPVPEEIKEEEAPVVCDSPSRSRLVNTAVSNAENNLTNTMYYTPYTPFQSMFTADQLASHCLSYGINPLQMDHYLPANPVYPLYCMDPSGYINAVEGMRSDPTFDYNDRARLLSTDSMDSLDMLADLRPDLQQDISTVSFQSQRTMSDLLRQIRQTLEERKVPDVIYQQPTVPGSGASDEGAVFVLHSANVAMELQVCQGKAERALRVKKLAGDIRQYTQLCSQILSCVEL